MLNKLSSIALSSLVLATAASAQLPVFFDDFLADNAGQPRDGIRGVAQGDLTGFFLWTVTDGTVDLIGGNIPGATSPALGGRYVDLGGSTNDPGRFESLPVTLTGVLDYTLTFEYNSVDGNDNSAQVSVAGQTFTFESSDTAFQTFTRTFSVDPSITLTSIAFQDLGSSNDGIGIDRVVLVPAAPVPEPATMAVLGLGAIALIRRRKAR